MATTKVTETNRLKSSVLQLRQVATDTPAAVYSQGPTNNSGHIQAIFGSESVAKSAKTSQPGSVPVPPTTAAKMDFGDKVAAFDQRITKAAVSILGTTLFPGYRIARSVTKALDLRIKNRDFLATSVIGVAGLAALGTFLACAFMGAPMIVAAGLPAYMVVQGAAAATGFH